MKDDVFLKISLCIFSYKYTDVTVNLFSGKIQFFSVHIVLHNATFSVEIRFLKKKF